MPKSELLNKGDEALTKHSEKAIEKKDRQTAPYITKFERARVLGARALQLSYGAPPTIQMPPGVTDPLEIAERELENNAIPMIIRRYLPDGCYEDWDISELMQDPF
eukprot:gnl/Chilomastix_caulleri/1584.p1 GENE.gnl/Chilomastix_caulleri/1584~~gnl/Chilomastix_caulleri/1584.p1  ORF type:complete len:106 (+),score=28.47 gnl/Chilomastix_caulleri/1584:77-394(+)